MTKNFFSGRLLWKKCKEVREIKEFIKKFVYNENSIIFFKFRLKPINQIINISLPRQLAIIIPNCY